jgi:hypothetical protein
VNTGGASLLGATLRPPSARCVPPTTGPIIADARVFVEYGRRAASITAVRKQASAHTGTITMNHVAVVDVVMSLSPQKHQMSLTSIPISGSTIAT